MVSRDRETGDGVFCRKVSDLLETPDVPKTHIETASATTKWNLG